VTTIRTVRPAGRPAAWRRVGGATPTGLVFIVPALIAFGVFIAYPLVRTFTLSTTSTVGFGDSVSVGLRNYWLLLHDPVFLKAARVTAIYTLVTTVLQTVVPLALALLIHAGPRRSAIIYRTILFVPATISLAVTGLLWRLGFAPTFGPVNRILADIGLGSLQHPWLGDTSTVLPAIIVVSLWQSTGLFVLIFHARLSGLDPTISDAARIDGASALREAWSVTIPSIRPVIDLVVMLNVISGLKVFDLNYVMTNGGPLHASESFSTYTYQLTFGSTGGGVSSLGYGSALSAVVFLLTAVITIVLYRLRRSEP